MTAADIGRNDDFHLAAHNPPPWPFSERITPDAYSTLGATAKEDIEDYIELKLMKQGRIAQKSASTRKTRTA